MARSMFNEKSIQFTAIGDEAVEANIKGFTDAELLEVLTQNLTILASQIARTHNCGGDRCNVQESATRLLIKLKEFEDDQKNFYSNHR